jgi:hypothetical protein
MPDLPDATPPPFDLDLVGSRYGIPPYRIEELVALRRGGASAAELLASVRTPTDDGTQPATPIALSDEQGRDLLADLARLSV